MHEVASHMVRCGELIEPLVARLLEHALAYDVLQIDETRMQVLKDGRRAQSPNRMWVLRGGPPHKPAIPGTAMTPVGAVRRYRGGSWPATKAIRRVTAILATERLNYSS